MQAAYGDSSVRIEGRVDKKKEQVLGVVFKGIQVYEKL